MALSVVKALNKNNKNLPFSKFAKGFVCVGLGLGVANCASKPQYASNKSSEIGAFTHAKYGKASERVVADGDDVPKGGGRYQVGKPYSIAGKTYVPREMNGKYSAVGMASWYGAAFHGRKTANGEVYDKNSITAAHPTMPLPSYARVTNVNNGRSIIVRVNDRGPYHGGRVMDVSQKVAESLEFRHLGTAKLRIDHLGPAGLAGSDDRKLLASLTTGVPAQLEGVSQPQVQIASADSSYAPAFVTSAPAYKSPAYKAPPIASSSRISTPAVMPQPEQQEAESEDIATPTLAQAAPLSQSASQIQASQMAQPVAPVAIPLPPQRPYDFGKIGAPIKVQNMVENQQASPTRQQAVLPRVSGSTTASFYAEPNELRTNFVKSDPFSGLNKGIAQPKSDVTVAIGVFKNEANARKIVAGLGAGSKAVLVPFNNSYKVVAGPFASVENAKAVQSNAKALGAADAKIVAR
jgi:rare lipoprotein A